MLQVDRAASCMLAPVQLDEFLCRQLKVRPGGELHLTGHGEGARLSGMAITSINHELAKGNRTLKVRL